MSTAAFTLSAPLIGVSPLPQVGVIRATGADAANFLHNQLTNDVLLMKEGQSRLAAYCNAKGRMQASFMVYKHAADDIWLVCSRDLIAQTVKRLSMFVLRAKVMLIDATEDFSLLGLAGDAATLQGVIPLYPAAGQTRALWLAPKSNVTIEASQFGPALSNELWQVGEVLSGVAWVQQATFEAFVPQMLNYESIDGVNFKKGCYPGQEVVARSQFRGTLKRRAFLVQSDEPLAAGQEVFSSADATQPCGLVAQSASDALNHFALVELQIASAEATKFTFLPLPYPLRDDI
jgi:folate-binding protein YgfZ